jgi:predicted RNase H-like HicB family nuclease
LNAPCPSRTSLKEALLIPYVLAVESCRTESGEWIRRASYPQLPGCVAEGVDLADVIDELESVKAGVLLDRLQSDQEVPLDGSQLGFTIGLLSPQVAAALSAAGGR